MGLDVGEKRIGVAVTGESNRVAFPECVIDNRRNDDVFERIGRLADEKNISCIVVGLPLNMDGTCGKQAEKVIKFAESLEKKTGSEVKLWDERLSTREAEHVLLSAEMSRRKRKEVVDKLAAQLILQSYIDSKRVSKENKSDV